MTADYINLNQKVSFTIGAIGKDIGYWLNLFLYAIFLTSLELDAAFIGVVLLIIRLISIFLDPIVGYIVDNTNSKYGRYRTWIMIGTTLNVIATFALFFKPNLTDGALYIYIIVTYLIWNITYSLMDIPYWSLIASFGSNSKTRDTMSAFGRIGTVIGGQIVVLSSLPLLDTIQLLFNTPVADSFLYVAVFFSLIFFICELTLCLNFRPKLNYTNHRHIPFRTIGKSFAFNDELRVLLFISLLQQIALAVVSTIICAKLNNFSNFNTIIISGAILQIVSYLFYAYLGKLNCRHSLFIISTLLLVLLPLALIVLPVQSLFIYTALYLVYSLCSAINLAATTAMTADCVDYGEFKIGLRTSGMVFSCQTMSAKLGAFFGLLITGFSSSLSSHLPVTPLMGIHTIGFIMPGIALCISIVMLITYLKAYTLNRNFFASMLETLETLRDSNQLQNLNPALLPFSLNKGAVLFDNKSKTVEDVCGNLIDNLSRIGFKLDKEHVEQGLKEKMEHTPCGISNKVAIAHFRSKFINRSSLSVALTTNEIDCGAIDGKGCDLIFLIICPDDGFSHLNLLGRLSLLLSSPSFINKLRTSGSPEELSSLILKENYRMNTKEQ